MKKALLTLAAATFAAAAFAEEVLVANVTYTDGPFPFYPMGCEPPVVDGSIHFEPTGDWSQFFISNAITLDEGDYKAVVRVKSNTFGNVNLRAQNGWGDDAQQVNGTVALTDEWQDVEVPFYGLVGGNYDFILQPEMYNGTIDVNSLSIYQVTDAPQYAWVNQVTNSELDPEQSLESFCSVGLDQPFGTVEIVAGGGPDGKNCIVVKGVPNPVNAWDTQFFVYTPNKVWEPGEHYRFHMAYKASEAAPASSQCHEVPGNYLHWAMLSPNPTFATEWQETTWEGVIPAEAGTESYAMKTIAFNLNENMYDNPEAQINYYFSDIIWESLERVEDNPVSISEVEAAEQEEVIYNLQGQRVQGRQGLMIKNGKKIFVK